MLGADGRVITVSGLELGTARAALAYNLSIAGVHTYHVGDDAILVHNDCSDAAWDIASKAFGTPGRAQELGFSSIDEIGAYVERVMGSGRGALRDDGARIWRDGDIMIVRGGSRADPGSVFRMSPNPDAYWEREMARTVNEP